MKASAVTQPFGAARLLRSVLLPVFVAGASLTIAVVGALLVGADSGIDWVNAAVEARAGESAGRWEFVGALGFAFAAGAVAAFNPCGFAMLPAYMGLYMGTNDKSEDSRRLPRQQPAALVGAVMAGFVMLYGVAVGIGWFTGGWSWYVPFVLFGIPGLLELSIGTVLLVTPATISIIRLGELRSSLFSVARQLARALLVGGSVTVGFVVLFAAAGAIIGLGARSLVASVLPWLGLSIGIALAIVGSWLIGGGKLYTALAAQAAARMGDPSQVNVKGYFMFGPELRHRVVELHVANIPGGRWHVVRGVEHCDVVFPVRALRPWHGDGDHRPHGGHWLCSRPPWSVASERSCHT